MALREQFLRLVLQSLESLDPGLTLRELMDVRRVFGNAPRQIPRAEHASVVLSPPIVEGSAGGAHHGGPGRWWASQEEGATLLADSDAHSGHRTANMSGR